MLKVRTLCSVDKVASFEPAELLQLVDWFEFCTRDLDGSPMGRPTGASDPTSSTTTPWTSQSTGVQACERRSDE